MRDSTTGALKTGLAYNSAGVLASYCRPGAARAAISLVTQTTTGAWSSGGFVEIDATNAPGRYRLDIPDAALAAAADIYEADIYIAFTGAVSDPCNLPLTGYDPTVATNLGLSALPTANPAANGGLPTVNASNQVLALDGSGNAIAPEADGNLAALLAALTPEVATVNDAAATTTVFVTTLASAVTNFYKGAAIVFTTGALTGQLGQILSYNGSTKAVTLQSALTSAPVNGVAFRVVHTAAFIAQEIRDALKLAPTAGAPAAGSTDEELDDILTGVNGIGGGTGSFAITLYIHDQSGNAVAGIEVTIPTVGPRTSAASTGAVTANVNAGTYSVTKRDTAAYTGGANENVVVNGSGVVTAPAGGILTVTAVTLPVPATAESIVLWWRATKLEGNLPFGAGLVTAVITSMDGAQADADLGDIAAPIGTVLSCDAQGRISVEISRATDGAVLHILETRTGAGGATVTDEIMGVVDVSQATEAGQVMLAKIAQRVVNG